jgi:hypothetical protein
MIVNENNEWESSSEPEYDEYPKETLSDDENEIHLMLMTIIALFLVECLV